MTGYAPSRQYSASLESVRCKNRIFSKKSGFSEHIIKSKLTKQQRICTQFFFNLQKQQEKT